MAKYADGEGMKPKELTLYDQCFYWRQLPKSGGILDQPYGLMERLRLAQVVYHAVRDYNAAADKSAWMEGNPDMMRIVTNYWDLREAEHGTE